MEAVNSCHYSSPFHWTQCITLWHCEKDSNSLLLTEFSKGGFNSAYSVLLRPHSLLQWALTTSWEAPLRWVGNSSIHHSRDVVNLTSKSSDGRQLSSHLATTTLGFGYLMLLSKPSSYHEGATLWEAKTHRKATGTGAQCEQLWPFRPQTHNGSSL